MYARILLRTKKNGKVDTKPIALVIILVYMHRIISDSKCLEADRGFELLRNLLPVEEEKRRPLKFIRKRRATK